MVTCINVSCVQKNLAESLRVESYVLETPYLKIEKLTEGTYRHISYLDTKSSGRVACNGLIIHSDGEAVIVDTPVGEEAAEGLISFVEHELKARITTVIPTHFHVDCLGSLSVFHENGSKSFGLQKTRILAQTDGWVPQKDDFLGDTTIKVGVKDVHLYFPGEGHTRDNVVAYFPEDSILFGGCLIKSTGATKGNLADANVDAWSSSVVNVMDEFPTIRHVVAWSRSTWGNELLEYTIDLFSPLPIIINENGDSLAVENHPGIKGEAIYEVSANKSRGYNYQLLDYENGYGGLVILKHGRKEFEFVGKKNEEQIELDRISERRLEWIKRCNEHDASDLVENLYSKDGIYYNHRAVSDRT